MSLPDELKAGLNRILDVYRGRLHSNFYSTIEDLSFLILFKSHEQINFLSLVGNEGGAGGRASHLVPEGAIRWSDFVKLQPIELMEMYEQVVLPGFNHLLGEDDFRKSVSRRYDRVDAELLFHASRTIDSMNVKGYESSLFDFLLERAAPSRQFIEYSTPYSIVECIVNILSPKQGEIIGDIAAGSGGFLLEAYKRVSGLIDKGKSGADDADTLPKPDKRHFIGFDVVLSTVRLAKINWLMNGVTHPYIFKANSLSPYVDGGLPFSPKGYFDVVMTQPPFKATLRENDIDPDLLQGVRSRHSDLLFVAQTLAMLKEGGRAVIVVASNVLFGRTQAHLKLRKELIESNQLRAVVSLPQSAFKPAVSISADILLFHKGGETDKIWYYEVANEKVLDLQGALSAWQSFEAVSRKGDEGNDSVQNYSDRSQQQFVVDVEEIRENDYDLSLNRYKEVTFKEADQGSPKEILRELTDLEKEIQMGFEELARWLN